MELDQQQTEERAFQEAMEMEQDKLIRADQLAGVEAARAAGSDNTAQRAKAVAESERRLAV
jgi:hypothetical protein